MDLLSKTGWHVVIGLRRFSSQTWAWCVRSPRAGLPNLTADIFSCEWAPLAPGENCVTSHQRNSHMAKQKPILQSCSGGKKEEEKRCSCMWLHNTCTGKQFIRVRTRADTKLIHLMERCSAFLSVLPSRSFVLGEQMIVFLCLPSPLVITGNVCVCMMSIYRFQTHKPIVFGWCIFVNCYLLFFHLFFFLFTLFNTFACSLITPTQVPVYLPIIPPTSDPLHRTSSCVRFSSAFIPTEMIDRASVLTSTSRWRYSNNGNGGYVQNWTVMVYFTYTVLYFEVEESKWKHVKLAI